MSHDEEPPRLVRIFHAAPGTDRLLTRDFPVVRGAIAPELLVAHGIIPEYQRNQIRWGKKPHELFEAVGTTGVGSPSDLLLCTHSRTATYIGEFQIEVEGPLFVLDGHQRFSAIQRRLNEGHPTSHIGVKILLAPTPQEERRIFYLANRPQTRVGTQVHARNLGDNAATQALRQLADGSNIIPRVQWDQNSRDTVITGQMLFTVALLVHGKRQKETIEEVIEALQQLADEIGVDKLVLNVQKFFEILIECFPEGTSNMAKYRYKRNVMYGLAMLLGRHREFWSTRKRHELILRAPTAARIAAIQNDAERVPPMLSRSRGATDILEWLVAHINKARKVHKLEPRDDRA